MALAHARYTGDGSLVNEHVRGTTVALGHMLMYLVQYNLLKNWTDYLVSNALLPNNQ